MTRSLMWSRHLKLAQLARCARFDRLLKSMYSGGLSKKSSHMRGYMRALGLTKEVLGDPVRRPGVPV